MNTSFIFENIISMFGYSKSLMIDQGRNFLISTTKKLTREFMIQNHTNDPYHQKVNGIVEELNKILGRGLTKVCVVNHDY
jgi:hypothetical protein